MLRSIINKIVSDPWVYNLVQVFFGSHKRKKVVQDQHLVLQQDPCILDLGGGTGFYRDLWPKDCRYICLDIDLAKLKGLIKTGPNDFMLLADVGRVPIKNNSIDIIFCNSMSHHISEDLLDKLLAESFRVLKNSGKLLFLDAVLREKSFLNRFLWALDRGEYPHTQEILTSLIEKYFVIGRLEKFSQFYDYAFFVCPKKV